MTRYNPELKYECKVSDHQEVVSKQIKPLKTPSFFQTLSFYFPPCGNIPPPVIMVQNVSFKYSEHTVS